MKVYMKELILRRRLVQIANLIYLGLIKICVSILCFEDTWFGYPKILSQQFLSRNYEYLSFN